ncbi:MAG: SDR family oxidoreductase [Gluconacetobacter diazotrophicus]|nr:SDR family oxidoreductase [Gluconacetobacter diazotrophicus]
MAQGSGTHETGGGRPVALVTGSAGGIGSGICSRLLAQDWTVYGLDPAGAAPDGVRAVRGSAASPQDVDGLANRIEAEAGRLDGLVSNAGIMRRKKLSELELDEWREVLDTNLTATFLLTRRLEPLLQAGGGGAIVTIASTRAHMSEPDTESYAASKGGLVALTHALAVSLGPAVRANCVSPGWISFGDEELRDEDHRQHPAGRVGRPADVASLVSWLLGPESGFVSGAEFVIDGGMTRKMIYAE